MSREMMAVSAPGAKRGKGESYNPVSVLGGPEAASQYGFVDQLGAGQNFSNAIHGQGGALAGGPMGTYAANKASVLGDMAGLSGPLAETLSSTARYFGENAMNAVGSQFANQGGLNSGAAAQAFGQAMANPFAQAQAQLQQAQLGAGAQGLSQLMGLSGAAYGQGLGAASDLSSQLAGLVAPQYMTNPNWAAQQQRNQTLWQLPGQLLGAGGNALAAWLGNR